MFKEKGRIGLYETDVTNTEKTIHTTIYGARPMSFGNSLKPVIEYKKEEPNLFEDYKNVLEGFPPKKEFVGLLINWFGNTQANVMEMNIINNRSFNNGHFFVVDNEILGHQLVMNINRSVRWIKYPKKTKNENELLFLIPYVKKYYGWSDREWEYYRGFVNLEDPELHALLDKQFAFEKDEARKLGIKREKIVVKYEGKKEFRGVF